MRNHWCSGLLLALTYVHCTNGGIFFPEELQTIFQLVYSYLPIIRTGTDSKVGVGFRVGPNADFQVLLELGPQISTTPSSRRREAILVPPKGNIIIEEENNDIDNRILIDDTIAYNNDVKKKENYANVNVTKSLSHNETETSSSNFTTPYTDKRTPGGIQKIVKSISSLFRP